MSTCFTKALGAAKGTDAEGLDGLPDSPRPGVQENILQTVAGNGGELSLQFLPKREIVVMMGHDNFF